MHNSFKNLRKLLFNEELNVKIFEETSIFLKNIEKKFNNSTSSNKWHF